ncbi:hypothetical protein C4573_02955 [Candidatus Woesearchaeota archaeon]|nr:MAG: hypothetical protein C4573_02955 [Candidatus Woesearchaeota archaeon]
MKKAQGWSIDLVLATMVFILIITIFYSLLGKPNENKVQDLQDEAEQIAGQLDEANVAILIDGSIDQTKLSELSLKDYEELRRILGTDKEFCIYLEDEQGKIIPINNKIGIGSGEVSVSGASCNAAVS